MKESLTEEQIRQLDKDGFLLFEGVMTAAEVDELTDHLETLWEQEGEQAGSENYKESNTRRLANLANKGDVFRPIYMHPLVLAAGRAVVGPEIHLSMLNARDAMPGVSERQLFHCDTDNSGKPDEIGYYAFTAIWMLDDFTEENGATFIVPGTHKSGQVPKEVLEDRYAPHPDEVRATGKRGDVFVFNGHCWHAGGPNESNGTRRAILAHYFRQDVERRDDRRQHVDAEKRDQLSAEELDVLGLDRP